LEPKFQAEVVVPGEYFLVSSKLDTFLLSDCANCIVLRAVVLTQYRRVTDGRTDGIAVASTALAMRRAVKRAIFQATVLNYYRPMTVQGVYREHRISQRHVRDHIHGIYTVIHKKRGSTFVIITLEKLV